MTRVANQWISVDVTRHDDYLHPCYLCDPYGYPYRTPYGAELLLCEGHRAVYGSRPILSRQGLPFGCESSWKRGTWA